MVAVGSGTGRSRRQEDEGFRRPYDALPGRIQRQRKVLNLLFPYHRANVGALCLDRRRVGLNCYFFLHTAGLECDVQSCNRVDLNLHALLYGRLEALHLDGHVVSSDRYVGDAINPLSSGCCLVNISGVGPSHGYRCAAHDRT